ncbi:hypothetical protein BDN72DRAFT_834062 [Pluteus cervinus]|uniref:Uncharacterized protein n=1 Tax=Pluteus cervinus TaxID=181527 RepID=A0ACD3B8U9_9AGAR|nr:hypothetical protein BDN72DRAFT_834062 [Pluteus cervinus]
MSVKFPTPIGGTPSSIDFAPSIAFAVAYGLVALCAYSRLLRNGKRTLLLIGMTIFSTESVVMNSLRAAEALKIRNGGSPSIGRLTYFQVSYMLSYVGIASDLTKLVRCLLVIPTYGSDMYFQSPPAPSLRNAKPKADDESDTVTDTSTDTPSWPKPPPGTKDDPEARKLARSRTGLHSLAFLFVATIPGIIASSKWRAALTNENEGPIVMRLGYVSAGAVILLTLPMVYAALWAYRKLPRVSKTGVAIILFSCFQILIVAVYRLVVLRNTEDSLTSTGPGSFNSHADKALFYIFHLLPEWLVCATLFATDTRSIFATGAFGDWRTTDETEKERLKREKKAAERAAKAKAEGQDV